MSAEPYDNLLERLNVKHRDGPKAEAICPAHDDSSPSLSVTRGDDGQVLLHCHVGCSVNDITAAIGLTLKDLFPARRNGDRGRRITATYDYVDEHGELLYQVVRFDPKDFRQRRPDGNRGWIWNLTDTRRVLYRLPDVIAAVAAGATVFITEGEKDADAIHEAGYVATCNPAGAGKWAKVPDTAKVLAGADVIIVADRDKAGYAHARDVAASLHGKATAIIIVEPVIGKDVSEHLGAGRTVEELVVIAGTEPGDPPLTEELGRADGAGTTDTPPRFRRWRLSEVVAEGLEYQWLVTGMLLADSYGITAGELKSLKSWIGLARDVAIAAGIPVLGKWPVPERKRVLVYAGEGGRKLLTRRVQRLAAAYNVPLDDLDDWLQIVDDVGPLTSDTFRARLTDHLRDWQPSLVHLDPLYPYQPGQVDAHRYAEVGQMLTGAQRLCAEHDAMFWTTAHMNQSGQGFDLKRIAGAGHGEWGDSWMLVKHRQTPDIDAGAFRLLVDIGSRQWGGGSFNLDLNIGGFNPDLGEHDGTVHWSVRPARTAADGPTDDPLVDVKLEVLRVGRKARKPLTRQSWLARVERRAELKRSAFDELVSDGQIVEDAAKPGTYSVAEGR